MSFDIDPREHERRILCYYSRNDYYFIVKSQAAFDSFNIDNEIEDVTGDKYHEEQYLQNCDQLKKKGTER